MHKPQPSETAPRTSEFVWMAIVFLGLFAAGAFDWFRF
jgi:hypothetical protein